MNREIYQPLMVGVLVISLIMSFSISLKFYILLILLSLSFTLYKLNKNKLSLYFLSVSISIFLATVGVNVSSLENTRSFLPVSDKEILKGDITITKDSSPVESGYISYGVIDRIVTNQTDIDSNFSVTVFSKYNYYRGAIIKDVDISFKGDTPSVKTDSTPLKYSSVFYLYRYRIISWIKLKTFSPLFFTLLTGNKSSLTRETINLFRITGCSHILALSGFHVSIITLLIVLLCRFFVSGNLTLLIAVGILGIYLLIVGLTPSLLRSIIMFSIGVFLKIKNIKTSILNILILSFYIVILLMPYEFYTLSFKLSYLALFGILTLSSEIDKLLKLIHIPTIISYPISASLSAMVITSFVVLPTFGTIYPIGIVASVVITPLITIFIWLGVLSLLITPLNYILIFLEDIICFILNFFSKFSLVEKSVTNNSLITFIMIIIPAILLILKINRSKDVRGFNLKFKL